MRESEDDLFFRTFQKQYGSDDMDPEPVDVTLLGENIFFVDIKDLKKNVDYSGGP